MHKFIVRQNNFENIQLDSLKKLYDIDYMCEKNKIITNTNVSFVKQTFCDRSWTITIKDQI